MSPTSCVYYLAVEFKTYASLKAMIRHIGTEGETEEWYQPFIEQARFHDSDIVIVDQKTLGDPEHKVCMGLKFEPGGSVRVFACYFGESSEDKGEVVEFAKQLAAEPEFAKRRMYMGTFRPTLSRELPQ
ncbi:MAG: hypothetical protein KF683_00850 [Rubrivivax sp.]|nr:hypothetical protein [Rubrivivax sp.]